VGTGNSATSFAGGCDVTVRPRGPITWTPRDPFGKALLADITDRLDQHRREGTLPRSPRGLFYDLRPTGFGRGLTYTKHPEMRRTAAGQPRKANPMDVTPALVTEYLIKARRAGIVPERWIEDGRAPEPSVPWYDDSTAEEIADRLVSEIRDPYVSYSPQRGQPVHLEVLTEAAGLIGRTARIAGQYGVPVYSGGGYDGLKAKRALGERAAGRDVPTVVLRISDYDRHGLIIATAGMEDSIAWAGHFGADDGWLTVERVALTEAQAREHDLLDGDGKAEADGLPVPVMDGILRDTIERHQDPAVREQNERDAETERARIGPLVIDALNRDDDNT
jgi:hypothetical protein